MERMPRRPTEEHNLENNKIAREFNQQRWEKESGQNTSAVTGRPDVIDVMRAEALRENEDFEKRKGVNFEWQQKTLKLVIENLFEKRDNSESPKKVGIYIMGGGMKAASLSGVIWALNRMGLSIDVFDVAVGA